MKETTTTREKQPTRFGKYSKTIRELHESNAALASVLGGIIERQAAEIERLKVEVEDLQQQIPAPPPPS